MTHFYKSTLAGLVLLLTVALPSFGYAQTSVARRGVVSDAQGDPVVGATVGVAGTSNVVVTNPLGEYSIECRAEDRLVFTSLGYATTEVAVGGRTIIDVVLEQDSELIDDVIVIGYGTTTRRTAVGAVDQVKASALADRSVANAAQALQGTAPSLVIQQRSFDPNDQQQNINIRGIGTINNNQPLVVIDQLISDIGNFNNLNPADIESISILKDAGTAAIYGARAANGVLLVTTKKGFKNRAPEVKFNAMIGNEQPKAMYRPVEGWQNATLYNLYHTNASNEPRFTPEQIRDLHAGGNGTFFLDEIMQTALQQNYNVSISGGGENSTYMVSAGYYNQESNYVGPGYGVERFNVRSNITTEYKRWKITALLAYTRNNDESTSAGNLIVDAYRVPTYYYYRQQDPATGKYLTNDVLSQFNSLGMLMEGGSNRYKNDYINPNLTVEYKILDGLTLKGTIGADINAQRRDTRRKQVDFYDSNDIDGPARAANTNRDTEDWNSKSSRINMQALLDYNRTFGEKHHVSALLGTSNESYSSYSSQVRLLYSDPDLGIKGDGTEIDPGGSSVTPENTTKESITSVFGRVGYDFDDRYYAEFNFRRDGSSKFAKPQRWGFFPSVSLGWRISEEGFMDRYREKVGDLKLRASYGSLGNQSIGNYAYFTTFDVYANSYGFNNVPVGGAGFQIGNSNLTWETSTTANIAVDASFLRGAFNLTFDVFDKYTKDILVAPNNYPGMFGTSPQQDNIGAMKTQGWELTVNYNLNRGRWRHSFNFNIGDSWNELKKYAGFENIVGIEQYARIMRVGLPYNSYYGYKTLGVFQSYEEIADSALPANAQSGGKATIQPGDLKFYDRNGDGVINADDRMYLGNAFPRYTFGLGYNLDWKGFDFSLFLQGALKRDQMIRGELVEPFHANYGMTMYEHQLDFWTPTNTDARWPRLAANSDVSSSLNNNWNNGSDIYLFDGKYVRLKNIMLGYTLPEKLTSKAGIKKLRVYVNAQNLFTLAAESWFDPEMSEYGTNMNSGGASSGRSYPSLRYYGCGIDLVF